MPLTVVSDDLEFFREEKGNCCSSDTGVKQLKRFQNGQKSKDMYENEHLLFWVLKWAFSTQKNEQMFWDSYTLGVKKWSK